MVSSRNKGSKFLKKPWCSVDGRVWQGNLCLSNLELSPFVRAIELETSALKLFTVASFRYQLSLVTSEGRMPDFIATSRRSSFLLDIRHSRERWLLPPRGGGGVNLPDPHIRFCNIPHWLLNCSSFFPLQTLWSPPPPYKNSPFLGDRRADWSLK